MEAQRLQHQINSVQENIKKLRRRQVKLYEDFSDRLFVERSGGGIRMFKDADFEWLSIIDCLKKAGMPIKDIKTFVDLCMEGDATIGERLTLIERQQKAVFLQIEQMQETLKMLNYKRWYYDTAKKAGTTVHNTLKNEDVPAEFREIREKAKGLDFTS